MDDIVGDLQRRLANIIRRGVIHSVQLGGIPKCRVALGEIITTWLPLCQGFNGSNRADSNPAAVGDPVTILSEGGELNNGRVYPGWNTVNMPVPEGSEAEHITRYGDGTEIRYDRKTHCLTVTLVADGVFTINAPVQINGELYVKGNITSTANVSDLQGSMFDMRITYNGHSHIETGGNTTAPSDLML